MGRKESNKQNLEQMSFYWFFPVLAYIDFTPVKQGSAVAQW